jgi:uncharacterized protein (DUF305 family)
MKRLSFSLILFSLLACNNSENETSNGHNRTHDSGGVHQGAHTTGGFSTPASGPEQQMMAAMNNMMRQMQAMKPTGNADYDFAMMMRHHHMGAMEMAQAELSGGSDTVMRALAQKIYDDQKKEVTQFDQFIQMHASSSGTSGYGQKAMGMMTPMDSSHHQPSSVDVLFAIMMIPHHEDGVKMARAYLKESRDKELKKIAQNIIATQPAEVVQIRDWLKKNSSTDAHKGSAQHSGTAGTH